MRETPATSFSVTARRGAALWLLVLALLQWPAVPPSSAQTRAVAPVRAPQGMVASASGIASRVGVEILKKGGNAVDAAAAVGAVVAGVDLLPGSGGEWFVIEVNAVPGWRALAPACGVDVAKAVVRFLAEEYRPWT